MLLLINACITVKDKIIIILGSISGVHSFRYRFRLAGCTFFNLLTFIRPSQFWSFRVRSRYDAPVNRGRTRALIRECAWVRALQSASKTRKIQRAHLHTGLTCVHTHMRAEDWSQERQVLRERQLRARDLPSRTGTERFFEPLLLAPTARALAVYTCACWRIKNGWG